MDFIARLKYLRSYHKLTQTEFGNCIGLSQGNISDMERGKFQPSVETIISVCRYFSVSSDWLLFGIGDGPEKQQEETPMRSKNQVVKHEIDYNSEKKLVSQVTEDIKPYCFQPQKAEAVLDPDLKRMIDILKDLMQSDDPDLRGWTKVQFKEAFRQHCAAADEKKQYA